MLLCICRVVDQLQMLGSISVKKAEEVRHLARLIVKSEWVCSCSLPTRLCRVPVLDLACRQEMRQLKKKLKWKGRGCGAEHSVAGGERSQDEDEGDRSNWRLTSTGTNQVKTTQNCFLIF